eukprot:6661383-Prymnesium_polylepis.1
MVVQLSGDACTRRHTSVSNRTDSGRCALPQRCERQASSRSQRLRRPVVALEGSAGGRAWDGACGWSTEACSPGERTAGWAARAARVAFRSGSAAGRSGWLRSSSALAQPWRARLGASVGRLVRVVGRGEAPVLLVEHDRAAVVAPSFPGLPVCRAPSPGCHCLHTLSHWPIAPPTPPLPRYVVWL